MGVKVIIFIALWEVINVDRRPFVTHREKKLPCKELHVLLDERSDASGQSASYLCYFAPVW